MLEKANDMIGMAWRFIKAMARFQWAKHRGYETLAPAASQAFRNHECDHCVYNSEGQCELCDCLILAKTMLAQEECPAGKWSRVWIKRKSETKT
jgi:hypothetical protein